MVIGYVRHGEKSATGLTKLGRKQAKDVCKQLTENYVKIYCSPTARCHETAQIIAKQLKLPIEVCYEMHDRRGLTEPPKNEKEQEFYDNFLNYDYVDKGLGIETCKEYIDRNFREFQKIVDMHYVNNENVLIVAHSATLYCLNAFVSGIPDNHKIIWMRAGNCSKVLMEII